MGHQTCPTVAIQGEPSEGNPSGIVVINESDFDATTMTMCDAPEPTEPVAPEGASGAFDETTNAPKVVAPWAAK